MKPEESTDSHLTRWGPKTRHITQDTNPIYLKASTLSNWASKFTIKIHLVALYGRCLQTCPKKVLMQVPVKVDLVFYSICGGGSHCFLACLQWVIPKNVAFSHVRCKTSQDAHRQKLCKAWGQTGESATEDDYRRVVEMFGYHVSLWTVSVDTEKGSSMVKV